MQLQVLVIFFSLFHSQELTEQSNTFNLIQCFTHNRKGPGDLTSYVVKDPIRKNCLIFCQNGKYGLEQAKSECIRKKKRHFELKAYCLNHNKEHTILVNMRQRNFYSDIETWIFVSSSHYKSHEKVQIQVLGLPYYGPTSCPQHPNVLYHGYKGSKRVLDIPLFARYQEVKKKLLLKNDLRSLIGKTMRYNVDPTTYACCEIKKTARLITYKSVLERNHRSSSPSLYVNIFNIAKKLQKCVEKMLYENTAYDNRDFHADNFERFNYIPLSQDDEYGSEDYQKSFDYFPDSSFSKNFYGHDAKFSRDKQKHYNLENNNLYVAADQLREPLFKIPSNYESYFGGDSKIALSSLVSKESSGEGVANKEMSSNKIADKVYNDHSRSGNEYAPHNQKAYPKVDNRATYPIFYHVLAHGSGANPSHHHPHRSASNYYYQGGIEGAPKAPHFPLYPGAVGHPVHQGSAKDYTSQNNNNNLGQSFYGIYKRDGYDPFGYHNKDEEGQNSYGDDKTDKGSKILSKIDKIAIQNLIKNDKYGSLANAKVYGYQEKKGKDVSSSKVAKITSAEDAAPPSPS